MTTQQQHRGDSHGCADAEPGKGRQMTAVDRHPGTGDGKQHDGTYGHPRRPQRAWLQCSLQSVGTQPSCCWEGEEQGISRTPEQIQAWQPGEQPREQWRCPTQRDQDRQNHHGQRDARRSGFAPQHFAAPSQPERQRHRAEIKVIGADVTKGPTVATPLREHVA
ncbi:hypothetical protein D3C81_1764590 [compost metagenome]